LRDAEQDLRVDATAPNRLVLADMVIGDRFSLMLKGDQAAFDVSEARGFCFGCEGAGVVAKFFDFGVEPRDTLRLCARLQTALYR
jgi:hypothetical protein